MDALLSVMDVAKSYPTANGSLQVLDDITLEVARGEFVAIVGESGSGKSTLLHVLGTLDRPDSGVVLVDGLDAFAKSDTELAKFRNRHVGFVFQFHHLLPEFSAVENVAMPALIQQRPLESVRGRAEALLDSLGLADRFNHRPAQLSGGEQQRVAVARALMNEPALVLADEPSGNLDLRNAELLHDQLVKLCRDLGQTFVVVTHNSTLAAHADRVMELVGGHLVATVSP